jgi:hypothetical protein
MAEFVVMMRYDVGELKDLLGNNKGTGNRRDINKA